MFLKLFRKRIVSGLIAGGATEADATAAVGQLGDGTLLKWLLDGGIEEIVSALLALIALFGAKPPSPPPFQGGILTTVGTGGVAFNAAPPTNGK